MALLKKSYTKIRLSELSNRILEQLEETRLFRDASCIALYHALPGEVQTALFLEKWYREKQLLLPLVTCNDLRLLPYRGPESVRAGAFGILEPVDTDNAIPEKEVDLIIVPGVAFDRRLNRLGRGKGFYDRLLGTVNVPRIGICYDFQLREQIPVESFDKKMDLVITEKEILTEAPDLL